VSNQQIYGRTSTGSEEIQNKSGRLTQSERLVLIVLGDDISIDELSNKLPSLRRERIELAVQRLLDLQLVYERTLSNTVIASPRQELSTKAIDSFLKQGEDDPVTVMAAPDQIARTARYKALQQDLQSGLTVIGSPLDGGVGIPVNVDSRRTGNSPQGVPQKGHVSLSKVFPGGQAPVYAKENIDDLRRRAEEAVQRTATNKTRRSQNQNVRVEEKNSSADNRTVVLLYIFFVVVSLAAIVAHLI